jgi:hypothetical protein
MKVINTIIDSMPQSAKSNLISFVYLNMRRFSAQCRNELLKNKLFNLGTVEVAKKKQIESSAWDESSPMDYTTPSSPPVSSSNINSFNSSMKKTN